MLGLVLSGVTAFPLQSETTVLLRFAVRLHLNQHTPNLVAWIARVHSALANTGAHFPFLAYGTDWLAFAHIVIAVAFFGPWLDPIRNRWVVTFGLIACLGVLPLALIAGPIRGIPFFWRLIDCSFGVVGAVPLALVRRRIAQLESALSSPQPM
ncbi:MAG TPA: hypothetical protein VKV02_10535 [Acidobacteriaceae bacterium]|nr:hypothetical protein [Acidobacteriaceae bacterium]